ncbi:hypothetical protein BKA69DRAFT_1123695 [Paraphysoderma sedebokerense]|nr:hypothetical protein BKA69DRAFT_1123695 [Paraphysoderma sedebokerense]
MKRKYPSNLLFLTPSDSSHTAASKRRRSKSSNSIDNSRNRVSRAPKRAKTPTESSSTNFTPTTPRIGFWNSGNFITPTAHVALSSLHSDRNDMYTLNELYDVYQQPLPQESMSPQKYIESASVESTHYNAAGPLELPELLYIVLSYLQKEKKSLANCAVVNKMWNFYANKVMRRHLHFDTPESLLKLSECVKLAVDAVEKEREKMKESQLKECGSAMIGNGVRRLRISEPPSNFPMEMDFTGRFRDSSSTSSSSSSLPLSHVSFTLSSPVKPGFPFSPVPSMSDTMSVESPATKLSFDQNPVQPDYTFTYQQMIPSVKFNSSILTNLASKVSSNTNAASTEQQSSPNLSNINNSDQLHIHSFLPSDDFSNYFDPTRSIVFHKLAYPDPQFLPFALHCKYLTTLEFYICSNITDRITTLFTRYTENLQFLKLPGCSQITDETLYSVAIHCKNLKFLDLRACSHVSDKGLTVVARNCPSLYHINVGRVDRSHLVTDVTLFELAANCKNLNTVGLAGTKITNRGFIKLMEGSCKDTLERVSLNNCGGITDYSIYWVKNLKRLTVLELKKCEAIHGECVEILKALVKRKVLVEVTDGVKLRLDRELKKEREEKRRSSIGMNGGSATGANSLIAASVPDANGTMNPTPAQPTPMET